jgi:hypothetical protein
MINRAKNKVGWILLVIFVVVLSVLVFFPDLKIRLFDLPALEAKRQSVVPIISALTANDVKIEESHYPLREAPFCVWGADFWTYKSSRASSEIIRALDLSFVDWTKSSSTSYTVYVNDSVTVDIEWQPDHSNAGSTYIVRLYVEDPQTPDCGPD